LSELIETLELTEVQKRILRDRWLDQVTWMSAQASKARTRYQRPRLLVVVGGVVVPGLVTILLSTHTESIEWLFGIPTDVIRVLAFGVSLGVAMLAGAEEVLNFGDRWRHYRRTVELLKTVGWQYLELSGAFRKFPSHAAAFVAFNEHVEDILTEDVEGYLGEIAAESRERQRTEIVV
jgi:hypothetical protein